MSSLLLWGALFLAETSHEVVPPASPAPETASKAASAEDEVTDLIKLSAEQYGRGQLDEALETLERARRLSDRPAVLFNIGQVQRARHDCPAALAAYTAFAAQTPASDPNHARALRRQAEMQSCVDHVVVKPESPSLSSPEAVKPAAPPLLTLQKVSDSSNPVGPADLRAQPTLSPLRETSSPVPAGMARAEAGRPTHDPARLIGWTLVGAGVVAEIAALALQIKASNIESKLNGGFHTKEDFGSLQSEGERDSRWALVAALGGAAMLTGGGAILLIQRRDGPTPHVAALCGWSGSF